MKINVTKLLIAMGENGLTVSELAQKSGLSRQSISYIKAGKSCNPLTAGKIAKALNMPLCLKVYR